MKAFTLLELLIVMSIIGIMITLGIFGMISFRRTVMLQQATEEVLSALKETRTLAENNVLPQATTTTDYIYGYSLTFQDGANGQLNRRLCRLNTTLAGAPWVCIGPGENLKSEIFGEIEYVMSGPNGCEEIFIENLTGDILIDRTLSIPPTYINEVCTINIKHESQNTTNINLVVDGEINSFKLTSD